MKKALIFTANILTIAYLYLVFVAVVLATTRWAIDTILWR